MSWHLSLKVFAQIASVMKEMSMSGLMLKVNMSALSAFGNKRYPIN